ncbi:MAG: hypothetical protein JSS70_18375 [Bacteroidetes bacterium]|nr:hypothetical protein [Bacteroidota bacterium]
MSSNWTDRIKNSEINPPEKGWDKIASSLDDSFNGLKFPVTLYNTEAEPPADTWNKIQTLLDSEQAPVIPFNNRKSFPSFIKFAIAASIIGLLAFGAIRFFNIGTDKIDVALAPGIQPSKTDTPVLNDKSQPGPLTTTRTESDTDDNMALEQSKNTYAKLDMHSGSFSSRVNKSLYRLPALLASTYNETDLPKNPELQYPHRAAVNDAPSDNSSDRYLIYKNNKGQFIRISKKLSNLYCCVSGEEQDENCDDQLKKWREKIATSSFSPSPDNFMDILDLVNSLQDNRN